MRTITVKRWRVGNGPEWRTTVAGASNQTEANRVSSQAQHDKLEGEATYNSRYNGREVWRA